METTLPAIEKSYWDSVGGGRSGGGRLRLAGFFTVLSGLGSPDMIVVSKMLLWMRLMDYLEKNKQKALAKKLYHCVLL